MAAHETPHRAAPAEPHPDWPLRADVPPLRRDDVHVWRVPLAAAPAAVTHAESLLGAEERDRVSALAGGERKTRQILSSGLLRVVLGRYLRVDPRDVTFARSPLGKPRVAGALADSGLRFSVAHSEDRALYAVTVQADVGVDIERRRETLDVEGMLEKVLTPAERARLQGLSAERRRRVFFDAWALKEACLKATGEGVAGLQTVEAVLGTPGGTPALGICRPAVGFGENCWSVWPLVPDPDHSAAVVVTSAGGRLCLFSLDPDCWLAAEG